ncbi:MAG: hypothetical protein HY731_08720 [Candidatus Tectomicrobia bacterium]|nr:hypothetical protein [Candidatus Tectomicrobia bacterium]
MAKLANFSHPGQFLWPHYRDLGGEMQAELLDVLRIARYGIAFAVGEEREREGYKNITTSVVREE